MEGSRIPVAVAHGEGRADFASTADQASALVALRYLDGDQVATRYPANPNGSPDAIAGLTSSDGRATILMPHPERTLRVANYSWAPREWGGALSSGDSPWLRMFRIARAWVG
jgi:phosphoribosylformylglycinamidine synthase